MQVRTATNLLFIHIPELLVATCKDKLGQGGKSPEAVAEITDKEYGQVNIKRILDLVMKTIKRNFKIYYNR